MNQNFSDSILLITSSDTNYSGDFGTGFVIHQDEQTTYVLTCAHVVSKVGGSDKVKAGGHPAEVKVSGDVYGCDLAVLAVKDKLTKLLPLKLGVVGVHGREFVAAGFSTDTTNTRKLAEIKGKLGGTQIIVNSEGDRTPAWNLS
ncbi:trypsin-like peptidase domain-containing protein [Scytonema tolypothrichoides VB-61278]|nr:trypsin-like peptidase domain-containing protein [Scytonema tolypothrichoides VB-61278]